MDIYFSDFFCIGTEALEDYGALNISLINDLPVFIDPFLLFNSKKIEYQNLHKNIIKYLIFLREISVIEGITPALLDSWFCFSEVKQNWLGYSLVGNNGSGLGRKFAHALHKNLHTIFSEFGNEQITKESHLEKVCLIEKGIGRDNISDFTSNLIKDFLLEYTENFTRKYLKNVQTDSFAINRVKFNYETRTWMPGTYQLPCIDNDYVILTPKDILTKDETWINQDDFVRNYKNIVNSIPNELTRAQLNQYFLTALADEPTNEEIRESVLEAIKLFPQFSDYYIKHKEEKGSDAEKISKSKVRETEERFIEKVVELVSSLLKESDFYKTKWDTFEESYQRIIFLKTVIENNDGYKIFYLNGSPVKRESDLQLMFRLTWFATESDVNSEVNNGRGPVDYKISKGVSDKTLIEFKLASNSKLKQNLAKQVEVYQQANQTDKAIKVILYFSSSEKLKVDRIPRDLNIKQGKNLVLIDASSQNKQSASNVKIE